MVKAYIQNFYYGNRRDEETMEFSSIDKLIQWATDENLKEFYLSVKKNNVWTIAGKKYGNELYVSTYNDKLYDDSVELRVRYYHHGCTGELSSRAVRRLDVDGKCFFNYDSAGKKWIVTSSAVEKLLKPYVKKIQKQNEICYAD